CLADQARRRAARTTPGVHTEFRSAWTSCPPHGGPQRPNDEMLVPGGAKSQRFNREDEAGGRQTAGGYRSPRSTGSPEILPRSMRNEPATVVRSTHRDQADRFAIADSRASLEPSETRRAPCARARREDARGKVVPPS